MNNPLMARVRGMIGRAVLNLVNDSLKLQGVQVTLMSDQTIDDAEHFQHYGYTSVPHAGAEGIALAIGGSTGHTVVINVDDRRYRLKGLQGGEVALYTDEGDKIVMKRGNHIEVTAATKVTLITPLTVLTGDLHVMGSATIDLDVTGQGTSLHGHTHTAQGPVAVTSTPN